MGKQMWTKYHTKKFVAPGGDVFDSKREYNHWLELQEAEKHGEISDLRRQVKFTLIPIQRAAPTITKTGLERPGRVLERECSYIADFVYMKDGEKIVEDSKGFRTKDYIIKRKLMLHVYGLQIKEV